MKSKKSKKVSKFTIISKTEDLDARVKELTGGVGVSRLKKRILIDQFDHVISGESRSTFKII